MYPGATGAVVAVAVAVADPPAEYQSFVVAAATGAAAAAGTLLLAAGAAQLECGLAVVFAAGDPQSSQVSFSVVSVDVAVVPAVDVAAGTDEEAYK